MRYGVDDTPVTDNPPSRSFDWLAGTHVPANLASEPPLLDKTTATVATMVD